ncbi:MAG: phosphotransferase, partial [Thermoleophilia bacterium]|nr:phosphotransferase [Thermoleophilia bacterium]
MTVPLHEILASYEIGEVYEIHVAGGTAGKCWRVNASTACYFLRCRGTRTSSREAMQFDHGLRRHLLAEGIPTAAPIAAASGDTWVLADGRAFDLYPFVEGHSFGRSRTELIDAAQVLARLHRVAADYSARGSYNPIPTQFANAAPEVSGSERMDDPEVMLAAFEHLARHDPALACAVEHARRLSQAYDASVYRALPRWLIHGDYHPGNLLYSSSGRVAGVFDFDWACEHTRSRDLADGVYYFAGQRADRMDDSS